MQSTVSISDEQRPPYVRFERRAVEDRAKVIKKGIYGTKDVDFALITPHGSKDVVEQIVDEWFEKLREAVKQERWPSLWLAHYEKQYEFWKSGQELPLDGTPIRNWSVPSPAQVKACVQANVRTVEDLAAANEATLRMIGIGGRGLKERAVAFLAQAGGAASSEQLVSLRQENAGLKEAIARMQQQIDLLASQASIGAPPAPAPAAAGIDIADVLEG